MELDDEWEFRELLTYHYDGTGDPDMDGFTNAQEFADGTDSYQDAISTENVIEQNAVRVFPNPFTNQLNIELSSGLENSSIHLSVTDIYGKEVRQYTFDNQSSIVLNTLDFPKGVLVLNIRNDENELLKAQKIVSMK